MFLLPVPEKKIIMYSKLLNVKLDTFTFLAIGYNVLPLRFVFTVDLHMGDKIYKAH